MSKQYLTKPRKRVVSAKEHKTDDPISSIVQCVKVIHTVFRDYGFDEPSVTPKTIEHWRALVAAVNGNWVKAAKYKLAAFYAIHKRQPLPVLPSEAEIWKSDKPEQLLGGSAYRWINKELRDFPLNKVNWQNSFLESILQSKKGMPRPDAEMVKKGILDTFEKLTTSPIADPPARDLISWAEMDYVHKSVTTKLSRRTVVEQIVRTVKELITKPMTVEDRMKMFFPSTSANYIKSRAGAGAVGAILEDPELLKGLRVPFGPLAVNHRREEGREEERESVDQTEFSTVVELDATHLEKSFEILIQRVLEKAISERNIAELVGLAESLKIRVISKENPFVQTYLRNVWKTVFGQVANNKSFIINRPVSELEILNKLGGTLPDNWQFVSGDYADATNALKGWASEAAGHAIAEQLELSPMEKELFVAALTGHQIESEEKIAEQRTGQLMGSIVSFPVLCIINASLTRWALELANNQPLAISQCLMLINGDDVLFKGPMVAHSFWKEITGFAGLVESVGKSYQSREFLNMNSTCFVFDKDEPNDFLQTTVKTVVAKKKTGHSIEVKVTKDSSNSLRSNPFKLIKYINLGLLTGQKRSGKIGLDDQDSSRSNLSARARELKRLCPDYLWDKIYARFINAHRKLLDLTRLPWFIPEWLGGVGLPIDDNHKPSELDLRLAHLTLMNWSKTRPIPLSHQEVNWYTRRLAEQTMPPPIWYREKNTLTEDYDVVLNKKIVNLLFDSRTELSDLYRKMEGQVKASKAIKHNAKFYSLKNRTKLPQPLTTDELSFHAKYAGAKLIDLSKLHDILPRIQKHTTTRVIIETLDN